MIFIIIVVAFLSIIQVNVRYYHKIIYQTKSKTVYLSR